MSALPEFLVELLIKEYSNKALHFFKENHLQHAIYYYTKALAMSPESAELYHCRAHVYMYLKQFDNALNDLKKSIESAPDVAANYYNCAGIYMTTGSLRLAMYNIQKALELDRDNIEYKALAKNILRLKMIHDVEKKTKKY